MVRKFSVVVFASCLLTLGGCQKERILSEDRAPAKGLVTLDGEPLIGGGTVKFQSVDNPRIRVTASLDAKGQFLVGDAPSGNVRMTVITMPELYPEMVPIPKKYSKLATSGLDGTIEHGEETFEIKLSSK